MRFGSYVRTTRLIDYAPYTLIDRGETGRVIAEVEGLLLVKLTRHHPGLGEGNMVTLVPEDADALRRCLPPVKPLLPWVALATVVIGCGVVPHLRVANAVQSSRALEAAFIANGRTVTRVLYEGGHIYVRRTRYAADSVVGVVLSSREITPDEVPAEAARIREEE